MTSLCATAMYLAASSATSSGARWDSCVPIQYTNEWVFTKRRTAENLASQLFAANSAERISALMTIIRELTVIWVGVVYSTINYLLVGGLELAVGVDVVGELFGLPVDGLVMVVLSGLAVGVDDIGELPYTRGFSGQRG